MPSQNDNKISCHPEERSELRILPIMEDNKERWSDSEQAKSSPHPNPLPRRGNRHQFLSGGRGKQPYEQQRITDAGEGWHWKKTLKTATLSLALSFFITAPAMADTPPVPTLDNLHNQGATIPDTDPAQTYPESAYTLTEIENADPDNLPQNAITLYDKNEDGTVAPKYYLVNLKDSVTNIGSGDTTKYFEWTKNETTGNLEFKEVSSPTDGKQTITVNYDTSSLHERINNTEDKSTITDTFINQTTGSTSGDQYGGAIYNNGRSAKLGDINADFIGNYVSSSAYSAAGGAVYNSLGGNIGNIEGSFVGNYAISSGAYSSAYASGGAIYNENSSIGSGAGSAIIGDFIGNYVESAATRTSSYYYTGGGAIANYASSNNTASIGDIEGSFINNYVKTKEYNAEGGAIHNYAYVSNTSSYKAVAEIGNITGDFIGNYVTSTDSNAYGGAIFNYSLSSNSTSSIGDINGDFIGNYASGNSSASGGAIYISGSNAQIGDITGDFIGNYAASTGTSYSSASGGAIFNNVGTISNITGDFIGNYASGSSSANGGAIYNYYTAIIGNITGDFIGNYASTNNTAYGGAIYNYGGWIESITGNFIGNYASNVNSQGGVVYGGAISSRSYVYSSKTGIGDITGNFIGNYASNVNTQYGGATGGAIFVGGEYAYTGHTQQFNQIKGNFINNYAVGASAYGGAISNIANYIYSSAVLSIIDSITADFVGNHVSATKSFAYGGAIYNEEIINTIVNSDFIDNYAVSENGEAKGGAIYTTQDLNIAAQDGGQSIFSGNYTESNGVKTPNAIYVETTTGLNIRNIISINESNIVTETKNANIPVLTLNANTNGTIRFDDTIDGNIETIDVATTSYDLSVQSWVQSSYSVSTVAELVEYIKANPTSFSSWYTEGMSDTEILTYLYTGFLATSNEQTISETEQTIGYNLAITGDSTGKVILNNDVINANISLDNTNLYLGREDVFNQSQSLTLNSGSIYLNNQSIGTMHIPTLNLNGNTNLSVDVDLANKTMDRITADNYNVKDDAMLNVNNIVLLSDAKEDKTDILFADEGLASNVAYTGASPIAYTPIYKYEVSYNPDDGFFTFARASAGTGNGNANAGAGNISDSFNPAVLASPVAQQAGAYTTQLQAFNYAFQHADTFMNIPYLERVAMINAGKYALSPTGDATDVGTFSPLLTKEEDAGFWVKPYASFENVPLKNGPKVSNINYGTLIGYDSPLKTISHGFERVLTGYIGYNGASQRYQGVDAYQNGGLIGGTATFYKGNFFNATTLSVGATAGDASTMYGSENYTMLLAGIGNKTGYNFEFWDGKVILQPNFLISYTFVNTFDYNNAAGVRIESDPLHAIQLSPGLKLIGNTKNGWQPYIGVNMVWNLLDDSRVTANDVRLPEMSIRPYVQYGVGVQKRFKDKFLAFGQAMIHNGGRNGVSLTAGLRWKVGRE